MGILCRIKKAQPQRLCFLRETLNSAVGQHSLSDFFKTSDVGADNEVVEMCIRDSARGGRS